jgi:hypothetical protein
MEVAMRLISLLLMLLSWAEFANAELYWYKETGQLLTCDKPTPYQLAASVDSGSNTSQTKQLYFYVCDPGLSALIGGKIPTIEEVFTKKQVQELMDEQIKEITKLFEAYLKKAGVGLKQ